MHHGRLHPTNKYFINIKLTTYCEQEKTRRNMLIISFALTFFGEIESVMSPRRYVQQLEVLKFMLRQDSKKDNKKTGHRSRNRKLLYNEVDFSIKTRCKFRKH